MVLEFIADKVAQYFTLYVKREESETAKLKLGIEIAVHNILMISVILLIAGYLSILKQVLIFFSAFGILRMTSGGIHLKSSIGCLIWSTLLIIGGVKITPFINISQRELVVVFFVLIIITFQLAPQGTENNPTNKKDIPKLKYQSCILLIIYTVISIVYDKIGTLIMLASLFQIITLVLQYIKKFGIYEKCHLRKTKKDE
ncbi:MAG: accessory gene regulator B family protein [Eubacteriales bacterium]|nr:accessory gene regulator B family protein [Eubacteriales bacterium]